LKNESLAIKSQPEDIKRLSVIVGKDGYCIKMEVRFTKSEEKVIKKTLRKSGEKYHHSRPLILENSFYVFDG
jgi:hypothetical protein